MFRRQQLPILHTTTTFDSSLLLHCIFSKIITFKHAIITLIYSSLKLSLLNLFR